MHFEIDDAGKIVLIIVDFLVDRLLCLGLSILHEIVELVCEGPFLFRKPRLNILNFRAEGCFEFNPDFSGVELGNDLSEVFSQFKKHVILPRLQFRLKLDEELKHLLVVFDCHSFLACYFRGHHCREFFLEVCCDRVLSLSDALLQVNHVLKKLLIGSLACLSAEYLDLFNLLDQLIGNGVDLILIFSINLLF